MDLSAATVPRDGNTIDVINRMKFHPLLIALSLCLPSTPALASSAVLDSGFNPEFAPGSQTACLQVSPGGAIHAAGHFNSEPGLLRLTSSGRIDPAFEPLSADGPISVLRLGKDGELYVGGRFESLGGVKSGGLARLSPDGSINHAFAPAMSGGSPRALALTTAGTLIVGGGFNKLGGETAVYLGHWNPDGAVAGGFSSALSRAFAIEAGIDCLAIQEDGKILVGGNFQTPAGAAQLARLNPDGSIDPTFNGNPGPILYPQAITVLPGGAIFVGGLANASNEGFVRRLAPNGQADPSFNPPIFQGTVHDLLALPDGSIIAAGTPAGTGSAGAVRLLPDGALDPNWRVTTDGPILCLAQAPDGGVLLGGAFTAVQGQPRAGLAKIRANSGPEFHSSSASHAEGFRVFLDAVPGQTYAIEASSDLRNWSVFSTNTATNAGLEIADPLAPQTKKRFFRARLLRD